MKVEDLTRHRGNGEHSFRGKNNRRSVHRKDGGLNGSKWGKRIRVEENGIANVAAD